MTRPLDRLIDAASTLFVAWPVCALVWAVDAVAGRVIDARICRIPNDTNEDPE